jgi:acyl-CoA synthetase (AMP-forming)/AMP-acid ligase II
MSAPWLNLGQILKVNATKYPAKLCLKDRIRRFSFAETNLRVNRLANALLKLGLNKGDKVSVLLENCVEIVETYLACAKTGIIINPINFRLTANDVAYICDNADSKTFIVDEEFVPLVDSIRLQLPKVKDYIVVTTQAESLRGAERLRGEAEANPMRLLHFVRNDTSCQIATPSRQGGMARNDNLKGYYNYNDLLSKSSEAEPNCKVNPEDTWVLLYTSGTTGKPKGVVRSHESYVAFYLINAVDFGFTENDICLNVMPLCHVNSTYFSFTFTYIGGAIYINPARRFEPQEILEIIQREKITFISLIPTHYSIILSLTPEVRNKYDVSSIKKLLCSSAPARGEIKKRIMEFFSRREVGIPKATSLDSPSGKGVQLYEGYGSTEAGIVTVLKPEEQLTKLGSIGRESCGTDCVKILDENGKEVPVGEVGELYSRGPMLFDEYYKLPEKTKKSFQGEWFSAGDLARKDEDGYYYIVDRKDNLIITGGEHVYPSEVEEVITRHPKVLEVAVIGIPDNKWGESVKAIIIPKENAKATSEEIIEFCKDKLAGYKKPKSVDFIKPEQMPRTASGKILHRELRKKYEGI